MLEALIDVFQIQEWKVWTILKHDFYPRLDPDWIDRSSDKCFLRRKSAWTPNMRIYWMPLTEKLWGCHSSLFCFVRYGVHDVASSSTFCCNLVFLFVVPGSDHNMVETVLLDCRYQSKSLWIDCRWCFEWWECDRFITISEAKILRQLLCRTYFQSG